MALPAVTEVSPAEFEHVRERVARLDRAAEQETGSPALGEAVWRDLARPDADSGGFFVDETAYAHVARSDNFSPRHWALGVAVDPARAQPGARHAVLDAALTHVAARGGGRVVLWVLGATAADDTELAAVGLAPARDLYEMRVALPIAETAKLPSGYEVRTFEPGRDERAWLEVNNRAFANHAEQGGWIETTLARRMADDWFDPTLFFLAFDAEGLAGFNWIKMHDAHGRDPGLGEIFVIGVDPRAQGTGLGRALALIGLDAAHQRGVDTGSLFVAAENAGAKRLYESLGFSIHRTDRAYERELAPQ
jgi:mycothiol synthase